MATSVLVEAESFTNRGGWVVDQQFVQQMGSPYLLAHGLGKPVADAVTTAHFPATGLYRLWVRTRDWVPEHADDPGRFRVLVAGRDVGTEFGTESDSWHWQDGGVLPVSNTMTQVALQDLTGFEGRCDALAFLSDTNAPPPSEADALAEWRRVVLRETVDPPVTQSFDCVVVGGGLAGCGATIAAARGGVRVALIQDRPVLGGNASQDVRVHTLGEREAGRNNIVAGLQSTGESGLDTFVGYDSNRLAFVSAETNATLIMPWRAYGVVTNVDRRITAVDARHIRTGERLRVKAPLFIDCTGDGWIGYWAGAGFRMGREARDEYDESLAPDVADGMTMGNTVWWRSYDTGAPVVFPEVPWAMDVAGSRADIQGNWFWEYGLLLDTIDDAEHIRDHLFRAIYGSFYNAKQEAGNENRDLYWMAYIAGKRESRRIVGDHVLTESDVRGSVFFEDAVATEKRAIDIHYPKTSPPYHTYAVFTDIGSYFIPFRSLYSRDVPNLMMAGRCFSCTHVGLGSPRVMNTGGQMGVATGFAAAVCKRHGIEPRDVYRNPNRMLEVQAMIGGAWPERPLPSALVLDNADTNAGVVVVGDWTKSTHVSGYYGENYIHDGNTGKGAKSVRFTPDVPAEGEYVVSVRYTEGNTRATNVPVEIATNIQCDTFTPLDAPYIRNTRALQHFNTNELLVGRVAPNDWSRGILEFDLSSVSDAAVVLAAELTLTIEQRDALSGGGYVGSAGIRVYRLTEDAVVGEVTWSNRTAGTAWTDPGGTFDANSLAVIPDPPHPANVAAGRRFDFPPSSAMAGAVEDALAADKLQLLVRTPTIESDHHTRKLYRFASESSTNATWRPLLELTYHVPGAATNVAHLNQRQAGGVWHVLGTNSFSAGRPVSIIVRNEGTSGHVIADAVRFVDPEADTHDIDGDGLPNWWERWYFFSETEAVTTQDSDGDTMSNYGEYLTGTDPRDPDSVLTIRDMLVGAGGSETVLRWPSVSNRFYTIGFATDLAGVLQPVTSNIPATPPENAWTVGVTRAGGYYRISVEP